MIVVSNTSPIINLDSCKQLRLLEKLYGKVFIPPAVYSELQTVTIPQFLEVKNISNGTLIGTLSLDVDVGEAEAIALAVEVNCGLLLIDDRIGRRVASKMSLKVIGVLGILAEAKRAGLITAMKPLVDDMIVKGGLWLSSNLYNSVIEQDK